jgi:ATP synthase I chain
VSDPFLRRFERNALVACLVMSGAALVISGGRPGSAVAVLAGGALIAVSYWALGVGVQSLGGARQSAETFNQVPPPPRPALILVKLALRYALLGLFAYVMIARFGLHPLGLLAGASSVAAAASVEACRVLMKSRER